MAPLTALAALLALTVSPAYADASPVFDPGETRGWVKVAFSWTDDAWPALCPSAAYGVAATVRLRERPEPVYCLEPRDGALSLAKSGYLLAPGAAPRLLIEGFAPLTAGAYLPAELAPLSGAPYIDERTECAYPYLPVPATDRSCRRAANMERIGAWLRMSAGEKPSTLHVILFAWPQAKDSQAMKETPNAYYTLARMPSIVFTPSFIARFGEDDEVVAFIAAHEIGHHWQRLRGAVTERGRKALTLSESRAVEAEADSYAFDILATAGFPRSRAVAGQARMFASLPPTRPGSTHPLYGDRLMNGVEDLRRSYEVRRPGPTAPRPRIARGDIDGSGRVIAAPAAVTPVPDAPPAKR